MGLVSGGLNGRRFRITSDLPAGFRDLYLEQVREHAFVSNLEANNDDPIVGWVDVFEPANTSFELNTFLFDRFLVLSLRMDKKSVNGRYLKIALAERCAQVMEERGLEKLGKDAKADIKEALTAELHRRALPSVSTVDVAWDIHTGEVIVFNTSEKTLELVTAYVEETFGVCPRPERMVDWLQEKFDRAEIVQRVAASLPEARGAAGVGGKHGDWYEDDPLENAEHQVAADFLTWLWLQSESSDGLFRVIESSAPRAALAEIPDDVDPAWNDVTETLKRADLTLWLESKLKLQDLEAEASPETTILLGEAPSTSDVARRDLHAGKRPVEARLGLKLNDLDCAMTLAAVPGGIHISGVKLPFEVKKGSEEKIFERMMLLDLLHTTVKKLFQQFFLARTSPEWGDRVRAWLAEDLAAK